MKYSNIYPNITTRILLFLYLFLSFYEGYLNPIIGSLSRFFLIIFALYFLVKHKINKINSSQVLLILLLLYYIMTILWTPNVSQALLYLPSVGIMLLITIQFSNIHFSETYTNKLIEIYKYLSFSLGILGILFSQPYQESLNRNVLTLMGIQLDPNNLVALYSIGTGLALFSIIVEKKKIWINSIIFAINCYCILFTGSRSGIILILAQIIILFFSKNNNKISYKLTILIIGIIITAIIFLVIPDSVSNRLLGKEEIAFTDGTGREDMWKVGLDLFTQHPLMGNGWGAKSCHNTYLTILVDIGILGSCIFLTFIKHLIKRALQSSNILSILLIITGLLPSFFIDAQNKRFFWNALIIPIIILNKKKNEYK